MTARPFTVFPGWGNCDGERRQTFLPAWRTGIQDTISWFVAGAHQWLHIPSQVGRAGIDVTPPTIQPPTHLRCHPHCTVAHYKHPFCFQHQILIPAPWIEKLQRGETDSPFYYWFRENESRRPFPPRPHSRKLQSRTLWRGRGWEEGKKTGEENSWWLKWTTTEADKWTGNATNICWLLLSRGAGINEPLSRAAILVLSGPNAMQIMYLVQSRNSFAVKMMKSWALLK